MRLVIAFLMVFLWPNINNNVLGLALFLCAWSISDSIESAEERIL